MLSPMGPEAFFTICRPTLSCSANTASAQNMYPHSRVELDNKWDIIQHMAFLSGLALVMVALRIVSKLIQWRRLATDDHLLLASTVQMMAMNILFVYGEPCSTLSPVPPAKPTEQSTAAASDTTSPTYLMSSLSSSRKATSFPAS